MLEKMKAEIERLKILMVEHEKDRRKYIAAAEQAVEGVTQCRGSIITLDRLIAAEEPDEEPADD